MRAIFVLIIMVLGYLLNAQEVALLYEKNKQEPVTDYEHKLVAHVQTSIEKALKLESKLTGKLFEECSASKKWRLQTLPNYHKLNELPNYSCYHLLNNLCSLQSASHLHVGVLAGDSLIAALYQNENLLSKTVVVDWFKECPKKVFESNCTSFLANNAYHIINASCFEVNIEQFKTPIDIYFYDADHSLTAQAKAFTFYNPVFAPTFVAVVDDWCCPWIRVATYKAFDELGYSILYETAFTHEDASDHGQYVAVIRKTDHIFKENQSSSLKTVKNSALANLKKQLCKKLQDSWCSEEKIELITQAIYQQKPKVCVEIGVYSGSSFLPIASTLKLIGSGHAYAIEPWSNEEAVKGLVATDSHYHWWSAVDMELAYRRFLKTLNSLDGYYTILQKTSAEAAKELAQIDFLHLDGNFSTTGSLEEAELYLPKVSPGGYILLSNTQIVSNQCHQKMATLCYLLEHCTIVAEADHSNTILFRKN